SHVAFNALHVSQANIPQPANTAQPAGVHVHGRPNQAPSMAPAANKGYARPTAVAPMPTSAARFPMPQPANAMPATAISTAHGWMPSASMHSVPVAASAVALPAMTSNVGPSHGASKLHPALVSQAIPQSQLRSGMPPQKREQNSQVIQRYLDENHS